MLILLAELIAWEGIKRRCTARKAHGGISPFTCAIVLVVGEEFSASGIEELWISMGSSSIADFMVLSCSVRMLSRNVPCIRLECMVWRFALTIYSFLESFEFFVGLEFWT